MNNQSSDESTDEEEIRRNFEKEARLIVETDTLPKKSAERYLLVYDTYQKWRTDNRNVLSQSEEDNLIVYFKTLSKKLSPPTLWSIFSMLKSTLYAKHNIDIKQFHQLRCFIKNYSKGYNPKKSAVLTWGQVTEFLDKAADYNYLVHKVALIFGICGATRCDELSKLQVADVENFNGKYLVSINDSKNGLPRKFVVGDIFYKTVEEYISSKPADFKTERFFIHFHKGKCHRQVTLSYYYTGHCFRRTSATLLSNSGANTTMLKQLGGWKSTSIAEDYVQNSLINKQKIFDYITFGAEFDVQPSTSRTRTTKSINSESNKVVAQIDVHLDQFSEDFNLDDSTLADIEMSTTEKSQPPLPMFTTGNNKAININLNSKTTQPTHFLQKPPISVFSRNKENEPPHKKLKTNIRTNELVSEPTSMTPTTNPNIKYENCIFHGNIMKNFYNSNVNLMTITSNIMNLEFINIKNIYAVINTIFLSNCIFSFIYRCF